MTGNIEPTRVRPARTAGDEARALLVIGGIAALACCCGGGFVGVLWAVFG
jgi:hypothetical protein